MAINQSQQTQGYNYPLPTTLLTPASVGTDGVRVFIGNMLQDV